MTLIRVSLVTPLFALLLPFTSGARVHAEVAPNTLSEAERRGGWTLLFDGKTTKGWRNFRESSIRDGWTVQDGALVRARDQAGDIITADQFDNFELSIEYRISVGGNSGLMFHVTEDDTRAPWTGPEVQIQDNVQGKDPQKSGWLYQLYQPTKPEWAVKVEAQAGIKTPDIDDATWPAGEWNRIYLRVSPQQCEVAINGVSYYYFRKGDSDWNRRVAASKFAEHSKFGKANKGHFCLQDHGNEVAFRNIKVRSLRPDGTVPNPIDGKLAVKPVPAFPDIKWEGWEGVDENGRIRMFRPMVLTHANDGSGRIFVASQRGVIYVLANAQAREAKVFLDLTNRVHDFRADNEEGLLGLAFHPQYRSNGQLFVYYSSEAELRNSIVSRFQVSATDPNRADPNSEQLIMKIPQPFANHNGGSIAFGPDGYLYIALGDGGGRNDPLIHGQNLETWMGSILRIDVNNRTAGRGYGIPADNPFVSRPKAQPEIFAYGFRNVWRMAFDSKTGLIWAADVGQDLWEEINIVERGGNYGWSSREGSFGFGNQPANTASKPVDPIWEYDHQVGKSITGGMVYRGQKTPELQGMYLYADFVSGKIWALEYDPTSRTVKRNLGLLDGGVPVLSFGEDGSGEVYYLVESTSGQSVFRFESASPAR